MSQVSESPPPRSSHRAIRGRTPEPPYSWTSKTATRIIREKLDGDSLQPLALSVYYALAENASDKGAESFSTLQSHLGKLAGDISTRTVQRCLPILREIGVIDYETPKLRGPITFSILSVTSDSRNDTTEGRNDTPDSRNVTTETILPLRRTIEVTKKELDEGTRKQPRERVEDRDFISFWEAYPRKVAKPSALTAWKKAKLPSLDEILSAIKSQAASDQWQKESGKFIPHPASWINAERWNDQATVITEEVKSYAW